MYPLNQFVAKTTSATPAQNGMTSFLGCCRRAAGNQQPPSKKNWKMQLDKVFRISCNSYIRLCINIFKNLGHGEVMVCDKQKFVQKNTMSQRWWYWKDPDKFLVLKKIPAHRPYALVSIHSFNLRKRVGIMSVMDVATSCLFSGLRRMPACRHGARACSEPMVIIIGRAGVAVQETNCTVENNRVKINFY